MRLRIRVALVPACLGVYPALHVAYFDPLPLHVLTVRSVMFVRVSAMLLKDKFEGLSIQRALSLNESMSGCEHRSPSLWQVNFFTSSFGSHVCLLELTAFDARVAFTLKSAYS